MARREWAEQQVDKVSVFRFLDRDDNSLCVPDAEAVKLLRKEHARAVRIVKRAKALQFHGLRDTDTNEFLEGYKVACVDILAALQKGRA